MIEEGINSDQHIEVLEQGPEKLQIRGLLIKIYPKYKNQLPTCEKRCILVGCMRLRR